MASPDLRCRERAGWSDPVPGGTCTLLNTNTFARCPHDPSLAPPQFLGSEELCMASPELGVAGTSRLLHKKASLQLIVTSRLALSGRQDGY